MRLGEALDDSDHLLAQDLPELPTPDVSRGARQSQGDGKDGVHPEVLLALQHRDDLFLGRIGVQLSASLSGPALQLENRPVELEE